MSAPPRAPRLAVSVSPIRPGCKAHGNAAEFSTVKLQSCTTASGCYAPGPWRLLNSQLLYSQTLVLATLTTPDGCYAHDPSWLLRSRPLMVATLTNPPPTHTRMHARTHARTHTHTHAHTHLQRRLRPPIQPQPPHKSSAPHAPRPPLHTSPA
eukprot:353466-Chlamydomonas_euryale.AAC.3